MSELTRKTLSELRDGFRARDFTAREIAESFNAAVAGAKALNAYTVTTPSVVLFLKSEQRTTTTTTTGTKS